MERWVPLTQYALEEGISISTLRRKIKANAIEHRLDNGRYLIRAAQGPEMEKQQKVFFRESHDTYERKATTPSFASAPKVLRPQEKEAMAGGNAVAEMELRWRALEARINGLAKKVDYLIEQNSELNMLVKVFEEKLNVSM